VLLYAYRITKKAVRLENKNMDSPNNGAGRITIVDVAKAAQVSPGTVSRVLNNLPSVDEGIRERVLAAVQELGYIHVPKRHASALRQENPAANASGFSSIVMCVREMETPAPRNAYYSHVLHGAEIECGRNNINIVYATIPDQPPSLSEVKSIVERGKADGLLLVGLNSISLIRGLMGLNLPLVLLNSRFPELSVDSVVSDFYQGTQDAMTHLLGLGHREIGFLHGPLNDYTAQSRLEAYHVSLIRAGLPFRPELLVETDFTFQGGEMAADTILERGVSFSALCCANDSIAIGALRTLSRVGLKVPEQVSVIGFDDIEAAQLVSPPLTTIHADIAALGSVGVARLLERATRKDWPPQHIALNNRLVVRSSTAPFQTSNV
jgi:DNA-binding LacI/PurR family transcriptional regulator